MPLPSLPIPDFGGGSWLLVVFGFKEEASQGRECTGGFGRGTEARCAKNPAGSRKQMAANPGSSPLRAKAQPPGGEGMGQARHPKAHSQLYPPPPLLHAARNRALLSPTPRAAECPVGSSGGPEVSTEATQPCQCCEQCCTENPSITSGGKNMGYPEWPVLPTLSSGPP